MKSLILIFLSFFFAFNISFAQGAISATPHSELYSNTIIPICQGENPDPDGDGWGWENMFSCHVGASFEKPQNTAPTPTTIDTSKVQCDAPLPEFKAAVLFEINSIRQSNQVCGSKARTATTPLIWNDKLYQAAFTHTNDMATNNFFSHAGSDGSSSRQRALKAGYTEIQVGENIAYGPTTVKRVHDGWMNSSGHCNAIMESFFDEVGVACVVHYYKNDKGVISVSRYWAMVLGGSLGY